MLGKRWGIGRLFIFLYSLSWQNVGSCSSYLPLSGNTHTPLPLTVALSVSDLSGGILQEHPFYICGEMQHDKTAKEKEQGRPIFLTDPDCPAQHQGDLGTVAAYA